VSDGGVDPKTFIAACRYAVGCDEFQVMTGGLAASPAERIRRALSALDSYVCGCMWCEMLGDRSSRTPPGPVTCGASGRRARVASSTGARGTRCPVPGSNHPGHKIDVAHLFSCVENCAHLAGESPVLNAIRSSLIEWSLGGER
jgi:hypothetical protein